MFKAKKSRPLLSQKSQIGASQSSNTENESENIPLGQQTSKDDEDLFIAPSQEVSLSFHDMRSQRNDRRRFLSQRSQARFTLSQSQGNLTSKRIPKTYFEQILTQTGVSYENDVYLLDCDVFRFQSLLDDAITKADNYPQNVAIIVEDIKTIFAMPGDEERRKLMATVHFKYPYSEENPEPVVHESIGNSMLKFLLQNLRLQKQMFTVYFREVAKRAKPTNEAEFREFAVIVEQMRMVNFRENSDFIYAKYFEILAECNVRARETLICGIIDFVEQRKHTAAMEQIMENIASPDELFTPKHLATFANLLLSTETLNKVREKVIAYIKNGAPKQLLYDLVSFMAKLNPDETETYHEVVTEIRDAVNWCMEDSETKISLFNLVRRIVNRCDISRRNWLKSILYVTNARDHKIIDPVVCFMIGRSEDDFTMIETFFKKRVREKFFTIELLQQMSRHAIEILPDYITIMTDLFRSCFIERDKIVSFFGAIGFRILFKMNITQFDHRYPLQTLIRLACMKSSDLPFSGDNDVRTNSLELLLEIKRRLKNQADGGFAQVERILDRSAVLSIDQFRIVIKLLCSLAYDGTGNEHLKGDLDLMAPKYVTNMHLRVKLQGIIVVFQILNRTMWTENPDTDESLQMSHDSNSTISLSQIPNDADLSNARLIKLTLKSSEQMIDALMLFHDELATIFSPRNKSPSFGVNYKFVKWLTDQILNTFQEGFVVTGCPESVGETEVDYFFNINDVNDEGDTINEDALDIGVNIAGVLLNRSDSSSATTAIQLMCPNFTALAAITYRRYNTSLETINALLGCSLVLPKNFNDEEKFLEEHQIMAIDMYFHVANWFRCVISAFITQNSEATKRKVLKRINQLIEIEASIKYLLQKVDPGYEAPPTTFQLRDDFAFAKPFGLPKRKKDESDDEEDEENPENPENSKKKSKKSRKKQKTDEDPITEFDEESLNLNLNETTGNLNVRTQFNIATQGTQAPEVVKHRAKYWFSYGKQEKYRQLDIDIMILLEEPLEIVYPVPENEVGNNLTLQELKFVLADLISKTESLAGVKKFRGDQQIQRIACVQAYMHDLVMSLKHVIRFKNQLSAFVLDKIREMNSDSSAERFSDLLNHAKICLGSCFHLLAGIFSWPNFVIDDYQELLRTAMNAVLEKNDEKSSCDSLEEVLIEELAEKTLEKVIGDEPSVMDLRSAVHLLHLVKALAHFAEEKDSLIVDLAEKLLKREWFALDGTKECTKNSDILLTEILKCFTRDMELPKLEEILNFAASEIIGLKQKTDWMRIYPNFNRQNCTIFYRVMAVTCEQAMKHCVATVVRTKDLLECWMRCFNVLQVLLMINEENPILTNTSTFLRVSHSIMRIFRSSGVKSIEKMVHRNQQSVQDLLKAMQKTTRFLHSLSVDSKAKSNSRALKQVPKVRELMEKLVLEVKSAVAGNHALSGFWVSNLANKDVYGEKILSQLSQQIENGQEEEEQEIEDDLNSPENSENEGENEETVSGASVVSRPSKVFD
ncbi:Fanconi anemia group D2 protein homolog isoform X2 [Culicoides brevitarsis]|uniref:Fanconi anemia group D2 protein homolog isoform X2 n=1 Tax=Culicoides brevitarsis TaxID=469753 RepID=UPI00307BB8FA